MPSCSVLGCKSRTYRFRVKKHFFRFPLEKVDLLRSWINAIGRENFIPNKYSKVCNDHFTETDFISRPGAYKMQLKPNAVPSVFDFDTQKNTTQETYLLREIPCFNLSDPLGSSEPGPSIKNYNDIPVPFKVETFPSDNDFGGGLYLKNNNELATVKVETTVSGDESDCNIRCPGESESEHLKNNNELVTVKVETILGDDEESDCNIRCPSESESEHLKNNNELVTVKVETTLSDDEESDCNISCPGESESEHLKNNNELVTVKVETTLSDDEESDCNISCSGESESEHKFEVFFDKDFINHKDKDPLSLNEWKELTNNIVYDQVSMCKLSESLLSDPLCLESENISFPNNTLEESVKPLSDVPNVQDLIEDISDIDGCSGTYDDYLESFNKNLYNLMQIKHVRMEHNYAMLPAEKMIDIKDWYMLKLKRKLKCLQQKLRRRDQTINRLKQDIMRLNVAAKHVIR